MRLPSLFSEGSRDETSFDGITDGQMQKHLDRNRYGDFELTDSVRPSFDLRVIPSEGYRRSIYWDEESREKIPMIMASVTREKLFALFMEVLDTLDEELDVVLKTRHPRKNNGYCIDYHREGIDLPVIKSVLYGYEDSLLNDGFMGIAVVNPNVLKEIQLDEHKLIVAFGHDLSDVEKILQGYRISCRDNMGMIIDADHAHLSSSRLEGQFEKLRYEFGLDG